MLLLSRVMRALVYARVSLDPQGQGRSIEEQLAECRQWADREGWTVSEEITETGSASRYARSTRARTQWARLTEAVASGGHDILLTWEASRATRQLTEYAHLAELCAAHRVLWGYSGTVYDLTTRDGRLRTGLDALLAADESARTSERIQRSVRARAAAGAPHGKLPYGYRREYDPATRALLRQVPDEETAPVVVEIFDRVLSRDPYYAIARDLTRRGVPTPRPATRRHDAGAWLSSTVKHIATNPTYAGLRTHKGQVVGPATWDGIVTREVFDAAQVVVAEVAKGATNPRGDSTARHLLTGIARCGHCRGPVRRIKGDGYEAYNCRYCLKMSREMTKVDAFVTERLLALLELMPADPDPAQEVGAELEQAAAALQQLRDRLDGFVDEAAAGRLSPASLARVEARLAPQIAAADAHVKALRAPARLARYDLTDPRALWEAMSLPERRQLVRDAVTVTLLPLGKGNHRRRATDADIRVTPAW